MQALKSVVVEGNFQSANATISPSSDAQDADEASTTLSRACPGCEISYANLAVHHSRTSTVRGNKAWLKSSLKAARKTAVRAGASRGEARWIWRGILSLLFWSVPLRVLGIWTSCWTGCARVTLIDIDIDIYPSRGLLRSDRLLGVTKSYIQDKVDTVRSLIM